MWDNLGVQRDKKKKNSDCADEFFIIGLDQKKTFHFISREYLWDVLKAYGFKQDFINVIKLLYAHSQVQINVNLVKCEM